MHYYCLQVCVLHFKKDFYIILKNSIQHKKKTRKLFYSNSVDFLLLDFSLEVERKVVSMFNF